MVSVQGKSVLVALAGERFRCLLRKSLFRDFGPFTTPVAVGDRVTVSRSSPSEPVVEAVLPRRSFLSRRDAGTGKEKLLVANVELAVPVVSVAEPEFRPRVLDRILVASERAGCEAIVVFSKVDLLPDRRELEPWLGLYRGLGYTVLSASARSGEGIGELRERCRGKSAVFAGQSGVGKSSLLNALVPSLDLATAEISKRWGKGCHTTSAVTWIDVEGGGAIIDTPGVRSFGIAGLEPSDIAIFFRDFAPFIDACRFRECTHDHEPDCAVRAAVLAGRIDERRYASYRRILDGMEEEDE